MRTLTLTGMALFVVALYAALATPWVLDGRLEPTVLGLPFPVWWTTAWVVAAAVAVAGMHVLLGGEADE